MTHEEDQQIRELSQQICAEPGCYNKPQKGVIFCAACIYGVQKASEEAIAWKKKKELKNSGG